MTTPQLSPFYHLLRPFRAKAHSIKLETEDGPRVVEVQRKGTKVALQKTAGLVEDLKPSRFEIHDEAGNVIAVWDAEKAAEKPAGYEKDDDDTSDERLLKTFAHLIADAYRDSKQGMLEIVQTQGEVFKADREATTRSLQAMEHALRRLMSQAQRQRSGVEPDASEEEDDFIGKMMEGWMKRKAAGMGFANGVPPKAPEGTDGTS
jgi:hypothetical protein